MKLSKEVVSAGDEMSPDPVGGPLGLVKHLLLGPTLEQLVGLAETQELYFQ